MILGPMTRPCTSLYRFHFLFSCFGVSVSLDCLQSSISSYVYSIVQRADRIARGLDASAKRETWQGRGWGPREILRMALFARLSAPTLTYFYYFDVFLPYKKIYFEVCFNLKAILFTRENALKYRDGNFVRKKLLKTLNISQFLLNW